MGRAFTDRAQLLVDCLQKYEGQIDVGAQVSRDGVLHKIDKLVMTVQLD